MTRGAITAALLATGLCIGSPGVGRGEVTDGARACQAAASKAAAAFVGATTKCTSTCFRRFWKGRNPETDCVAPYGGAAAACIRDAALGKRGAENRYATAILRACDAATKPGAECPSCYAGGDCGAAGYATAAVRRLADQLGAFGAGVFCERTGADEGERRCQLATARGLAKLVASVTGCYDRCFKSVGGEAVGDAVCRPPAADPRTAACIAKAHAKAVGQVDARCSGKSSGVTSANARPDCGGADGYPDGASWTRFVEAAIQGNVSDTYCGAPPTLE